MKNQKSVPQRILLLDYSSENNRGDAAMQVGLLELVLKYFPNSYISVVSVIGANQKDKLLQEHDHSRQFPVKILGGLKPTFYPIDDNQSKPLWLIEVMQALCFIMDLFLLVLISLKIPVKTISSLLPNDFTKTLEEMEKADLIIWKGKNFRTRKNIFLEIYRLISQVFHPLICMVFSKPIACVSGSIWNFKNPLSKKLIRTVFRECFFISVREKASYGEIVELLGDNDRKKVALLPDLSFAVFNQAQDLKSVKKSNYSSDNPQTIGITMVDWMNEGKTARENYKKALTRVIDHYLRIGSKIVIIPQVKKKWELYESLLSEILDLGGINGNLIVLQGNPTIYELFSIYSSIDILIATRMHSAIFSAFVGVPMVVIPYDHGGKWNIVKELGYEKYMINYGNVTSESLMNAIENCWEKKNQVLRVANSQVKRMAGDVEKNISMLIDSSPFA